MGSKFVHDKKTGKIRFYDDDGKEVAVFADYVYFRFCAMCGWPQRFEVRQTADGKLRDQPRCGPCRNVKKKSSATET